MLRKGLISVVLVAALLLTALSVLLINDTEKPVIADDTTQISPVINLSSKWKYLDNGIDPGSSSDRTRWTKLGYDDSSWKSANGKFGAKSGQLAPLDSAGNFTPTVLLNHYQSDNTCIPTYFFRSTYVGIDRVINHIAAMPEWDKKHMVIDGSSQGGGAALLLAGYNRNITALAANVPSMSDHGGYKLGRASGGPRLSKTENVDGYAPYFDAGNFAKFIKIPALVSCGFLDTTCAPSSIYAVYNQLQGPKQMIHVPREGHTTSKAYTAVRNAFIKEHLGMNRR